MLEFSEKYSLAHLLSRAEKKFPRALLFEESIKEKLLEKYEFQSFQSYSSTWTAMQLVEVTFEYFETQNTSFVGCYFERVKWNAASLRETRFINCTFKSCEFSLEPHSDATFKECIVESCKISGSPAIRWKNCILRDEKIAVKSTGTVRPPEKTAESESRPAVSPVTPRNEVSRFKILEI